MDFFISILSGICLFSKISLLDKNPGPLFVPQKIYGKNIWGILSGIDFCASTISIYIRIYIYIPESPRPNKE